MSVKTNVLFWKHDSQNSDFIQAESSAYSSLEWCDGVTPFLKLIVL